nr:DNA adenine methylase [uncultured Oscillibacter sp.]
MGNKQRIAPYVRQIMPKLFDLYLEPFGGSGAILLSLPKDPKRLDIYNDLERDLVNLFLCVRDQPLALIKELNFLPINSREEFNDLKRLLAHEPAREELDRWEQEESRIAEECFTPEEAMELQKILRGKARLRDVRRAAAYYKVCRFSFSGTRSSYGVKRTVIGHFHGLLQRAATRLQGVVIECRNAITLIQERGSPTSVIYCDPPYVETEDMYSPEFGEKEHCELHETLKTSDAYVIVSYNDCEYIRKLYKDFFILAFRRNHPMSKKKGETFGELIITNFDPRRFMDSQLDLFETASVRDHMELVNIPEVVLKAT